MRDVSLGSVVDIILGGTPKTSVDDYWNGDICWITPGDIGEVKHITTTEKRITQLGLDNSNTKLLVKGDVVISARGSVGKLVEVFEPMAFNQSCYAIRSKDITSLAPEYVFYLMKSCVTYLKQNSAGAVFNAIIKSTLEKTPVRLPDLSAQKKVSDILSNYDDLIENNRRRIQLLEESARLLYKEWFVHLRFPGHEHVKITDGVPEGWESGAVIDFYKTSSGGTPSRKNLDFYTGDINWVKTGELLDSFIFTTEEKITEEAVSQSSAKIFPGGSVLVAMYGATIGRTGILTQPSSSNQACCALMPNHELAHYIHAYLFLMENKAGLINLAKGAAQNNINQDIIKSFPMVMPPKLLMDVFYSSINESFDQIRNLQQQNIKLTEARDILLPRLMNGELTV